MTLLHNKATVQQAWDSYQALANAVARDPVTSADPDQRRALDRAHARWSQAFVAWDGR